MLDRSSDVEETLLLRGTVGGVLVQSFTSTQMITR